MFMALDAGRPEFALFLDFSLPGNCASDRRGAALFRFSFSQLQLPRALVPLRMVGPLHGPLALVPLRGPPRGHADGGTDRLQVA